MNISSRLKLSLYMHPSDLLMGHKLVDRAFGVTSAVNLARRWCWWVKVVVVWWRL
jgi:hypothetical protein